MELVEYLEERRELVDEGLRDFIHSKYDDELLVMVTHVATGGKRLRGVMALLCCEALGEKPERALTAACAVELAHAASLVKDDIMDGDEERRGTASFWKRFGFNLGVLVPDILVPHAMLFTQQYGLRSLLAIAEAWSRTAQGQLMDMPKGKLPPVGEYQAIISLKTAPLFEVACELGVRATKKDWHVNIARQYGNNCGMAFQVYDDLCDMLKGLGQPWEAITQGPMPMSLRALQRMLGSGETVTQDDCDKVSGLASGYLRQAMTAGGTFPANEFQALLLELPQFCCDALLAEVRPSKAELEAPATIVKDWSIGGVSQGG